MKDNIDIRDRLLSSVRTTSSLLLSIFIIIIILCAYLLQRSVVVLTHIPNLAFGNSIQMKMWGLEFSYRTLTILWPAALGCLCLSFYILHSKRLFIIKTLREQSDDFSFEILAALDPLLITPQTCGLSWSSSLFRLVAILPLITLLYHLAMTVGPVLLSIRLWQAIFIRYSAEAILTLIATILACILGFEGVLLYRRSVIGIVVLEKIDCRKRVEGKSNNIA
jgi:hypothetical protein